MKLLLYIHGKGGSAGEADHYKPFFPDHEVIGFDYSAQTPWEAAEEFPAFADSLAVKYSQTIIIANSIGAYFAMSSLNGRNIDKAFFISPVADMGRLILDMMELGNVTEDELRQKGEIITAFGETLSWEYLSYARSHPPQWDVPTEILYGGRDNLTSRETISAFTKRIGAGLTVMEDGEHWFHTAEQMAFLDSWIKNSLRKNDQA